MFKPPSLIEPSLKSLHKYIYQLIPPNQDPVDFLLERVFHPLSKKTEYSRVVDFNNDQIFPASHFGSVAIIHRRKRVKRLPGDDEHPEPVDLYDSSMRHILAIPAPLDIDKRPDAVYVTPDEMILWSALGQLLIFDQRGHVISRAQIFQSTPQCGFQFAAFFETGLFVGTTTGDVYILDNFATLEVRKIATIPVRPYQNSTAYLASDGEVSNSPILYVTYEDERGGHIVQVREDEESPVREIDFASRIDALLFSPDRGLVLVRRQRDIFIYTVDFSVACFHVRLPERAIDSVHWCASGFILVRSEDHLKLVGLAPNVVNLPVDGPCFVTTEVDGARIITAQSVYRLRPLDNGPARNLLKLNLESPGVKLLYAASDPRKVAEGDTFAELGGTLLQAVNELIEAVRFISEPLIVRYLLDAVVHVRHRVIGFEPMAFSDAIVSQRICNGLARAPFHQPLTVAELTALRHDRLLMRLCNRYQHVLAYHIADYVNAPYDPIYNHWAHSLILSHAPAAEIVAKLGQCGDSLDFTKLALAADKLRPANEAAANRQLAIRILELNPLKGRNVPLWIRWEEWDAAIRDSIESSDVSLLLYTLGVIKGNPKLRDRLMSLLTKNPVALQMWIKMYPGDPESESLHLGPKDLLERAGLKRDIFTRDLDEYIHATSQSGYPDVAAFEQVKRSFKPVKSDFGPVVDRVTAINGLCEKLGLQVTETPYKIFEVALEKDFPDLKKAASLLQLNEDEVRARRIEVLAKTPTGADQSLVMKLITSAVKGADEDQLLDMAFRLAELNRTDLINRFLGQIPDQGSSAWIRERLGASKIVIP